MHDVDITARLVVPGDVEIVPVADLPWTIRRRLRGSESDFAIYRAHGRSTTKLINAQTKRLLEGFREAKTLTDCLADLLRDLSSDFSNSLEQAYDVIDAMLFSRFLVHDGSPDAAPIACSFEKNEKIASWRIEAPVQVLEDSEVYRVRGLGGTLGALKISRPTASARRTIPQEALILSILDKVRAVPSLLDAGEQDGADFLVTEWCGGVEINRAATEIRLLGTRSVRQEQRKLALDILDAYISVHDLGIVHGDVYQRNLLAFSSGVKIIDFGLAQILGSFPKGYVQPHRGGLLRFLEPEYAAAMSRRESPPLASAVGEQYSIAALIYFLITGSDYAEFPLDESAVLEEICTRPPRSFMQQGASAWPGMEDALAIALAKDPSKRFPSLHEFRDQIAKVDGSTFAGTRGEEIRSELGKLSREVLNQIAAGPRAPLNNSQLSLANLNNGAAGVAYALYRASSVSEQPRLLDLANSWLAIASSLAESPHGIYSPGLNISPLNVGWVSPYHTVTGVHCVEAFIGAAYCDIARVRRAVDNFVSATRGRDACCDLTLGLSGVLLGATLLLECISGLDAGLAKTLLKFGAELLNRIWIEGSDPESTSYTGLAHGWAGLLYTSLRWHVVTGQALPPPVEERIDWLATQAEPIGKGVRWKWNLGPGDENYMAGWCGGTAGMVHLWTLSERVLRRHGELAERAAYHSFETSSAIGGLCCGGCGISWALLHLFKETGDKVWKDRAVVMANAAAKRFRHSDPSPYSLFYGSLATIPLAFDIEHPERAAMPFFGEEGFPMSKVLIE